MYFIDADIFRLILEGHPVVVENIRKTPEEAIWISSATVEEILWFGWFGEINDIRSGKSKNPLDWAFRGLNQAIKDLSQFQLLDYGTELDDTFKGLKKQAKNVKSKDIRLAAHAIVTNKTVVTRNVHDFEQIPGVAYIDWSDPNARPLTGRP